jgi:hypothetical protein
MFAAGKQPKRTCHWSRRELYVPHSASVNLTGIQMCESLGAGSEAFTGLAQ